MYNVNCNIRFKAIMLKSSFCYCSDAYKPVKGRTKITGAGADAVA